MNLRRVLFSFEGRIGRLQYLLGLVLGIVCLLMAVGLAELAEQAGWATIALVPPLLAFFWIKFAIAVKRLHDFGMSGIWCLLLFVPLIGLVVTLGFLFVPGEDHANPYGPGPQAAAPASGDAL